MFPRRNEGPLQFYAITNRKQTEPAENVLSKTESRTKQDVALEPGHE